jgi:hypothetical protein
MKILIGRYTLFEPGRDWSLSENTGTLTREIEVSGAVRADEIETFDRGNDACEWSVHISRPHASQDAALEFLYFHPLEVPREGLIHIVGQGAGGVERSVYCSGRIRSIGWSHIGTRTMHTYTFVGGRFTKKPPAS